MEQEKAREEQMWSVMDGCVVGCGAGCWEMVVGLVVGRQDN